MTRAYVVSTFARLFCGVVFLLHGTPKIFNLQATAVWFADNAGVPGWLAVPVAILEFFGGILLIAGFVTRILSGVFILEMLGAALFVHRAAGWDVFEGGYEYNIGLIILLLAVILLGPGPLSIDGRLGWDRSGGAAVDDDDTGA
ncbi:MAG TPA: DoxX family protein [Gemmatimonadota bacterium]|nr:DoxX family protein [Gemmatimonadota bacterium]